MSRLLGPIEEDKQFGVATGKKYWVGKETFRPAVLQTADGLTHYIHVMDHTNKVLRYVLRHDQREYLVMLSMVKVLKDVQVTCLICIAKGPERDAAHETSDD